MKNNNFWTGLFSVPGAVILGSILISISILISGGVVKFKGTTSAKTTDQAAGTTAPPPQAPPGGGLGERTGPVKVSVDDDPVLGKKDAPLTMIEFSDYECPFCKRHFDQTWPELKKEYVDTGKLKIVYRDLPLSFHDPMATTEAVAANCSREQGGDSTYFKYHDEIFKRTKSNGNGLTKDDLYKIATDLGLNSTNFKSCLDSEKYKEEVGKDLADAQSSGASGTPTFFIGKTAPDGVIEGTMVVGAQPLASFKAVLDQQLTQ